MEIGWKTGPISDRLSTFGYVNWTKECKRVGIRPVYGVELPVVAELGVKKPTIDWWTFFAKKDMRPLNEAVEMATSNGGLTYTQAQGLKGLVKLTGERVLVDRLFKGAKDVHVSLSPSTPRGVYNAAIRRGLSLVATGDNVYTRPDDVEFYRVALGFRASTQTYPQHIVSDEEFGRALSWVDDRQLRRALALREQLLLGCTAELGQATLLHPKSNRSLRELCVEGAERLGCDLERPVYAERLERELRLIGEKKYEDYFFIIADLMQWSRNHMVVGPARGSSCGSLVCYLLGITSIDPIPYGLIFERFIDTTRSDLPDIDLDFSDVNRHLAMDYMTKRYGSQHVARLGSVGMTQAKSALNLLGVALRIPQWQINEVGNTVIKRSFGDSRSDSTVIDTLNGTDVGRRLLREFPAAILADRLEDHPSAPGTHAAGLLMTQDPVINYVAIDGRTGVAMCDKYDAETYNLLKVDMLGLTQLSVFERTLELIGEEPRNGFLERIPLDDQRAFDVLNRLKFSGVFQFQYPGSALQTLMMRFAKNEKGVVDSLEDIVAFTALCRPGPLGSGMTDTWMRRRAGNEMVTYPHKLLEPYLRDTMGVPIYQENIMHIGKDIGDLSWEQVTLLRKAMSKSLGKEYFDKIAGDQWKAGAVRRGMTRSQAESFWDSMCQFGMWSFNRSHSVAYAMVTYWSLWLKAHHPVEFAAATLDAEGDPDKQVVVLREMRDEGVDYVPIDQELSTDRWAIKTEGGNRRKVLIGPLTNIKGVGPATVRDILDAREAGEELRPALAKRLANAQTSIASLSPIADEVARLHPSLSAAGIVTRPTPIGEIPSGGGNFLIIGVVTKVAPLNENEPARVARRQGAKFSDPVEALNLFFKDDTGEIFCKIGRFEFGWMGRPVVAQAKKGKSLYAVRGFVPSDFRMIRVDRIKYLGEMGQKTDQKELDLVGSAG